MWHKEIGNVEIFDKTQRNTDYSTNYTQNIDEMHFILNLIQGLYRMKILKPSINGLGFLL